jgi:hypothetical protein
LNSLPDELLVTVASFLDVQSLMSLHGVDRRRQDLLRLDAAGWNVHCEQLWRSKTMVSNLARALYLKNLCRLAYLVSFADSQRQEITATELCESTWSFRFKESAGDMWTAQDPWHVGGDARRLVFLPDGRVLEAVEDEDHHHLLRHPFSNNTHHPNGFRVTWRFVSAPLMENENRSHGAYLRLSVAGRDMPTYVVRRHQPTWGFLLENCWGIFASFPLPRKKPVPATIDANFIWAGFMQAGFALRPQIESQELERIARSLGIKIDGDYDEDYPERPNKRRRTTEDLTMDASLPIHSLSQWREALLYNLGATQLPEGSHALEEFNRAWREALELFVSQQIRQHLSILFAPPLQFI